LNEKGSHASRAAEIHKGITQFPKEALTSLFRSQGLTAALYASQYQYDDGRFGQKRGQPNPRTIGTCRMHDVRYCERVPPRDSKDGARQEQTARAAETAREDERRPKERKRGAFTESVTKSEFDSSREQTNTETQHHAAREGETRGQFAQGDNLVAGHWSSGDRSTIAFHLSMSWTL
jgi:hypothetical protein